MMRVSAIVLLTAVSVARVTSAQTIPERVGDDAPALEAAAPTPNIAAPDRSADSVAPTMFRPAKRSLFQSVGNDVPAFFSTDTAKLLGGFALISLSVRPLDSATVEDTHERLSPHIAKLGNWTGSLYAQAGGGFATYVIGRASGNPKVAALGGDLLRAQALSQVFVQGAKFAVERRRPDGSNSLSFPSGHSASSFATASVLQRYYGWKAGAPAYAFAGFVAASRMASNKHYFSDILMGAGIGIAAGRTVTVNLGHHPFSVGAAPTPGGAMVTFTKH